MKLGILGSGSGGNSLVVVDEDGGALIVDAGFSRREILARLARLGIAPERLIGMLLTHEHGDHSRGCRVFCDSLGLPLYATCGTAEYLLRRGMLPSKVLTFEPGNRFLVGGFDVRSFAVRHDAEEPVGFVLGSGGVRVGVATDLGEVNAVARRNLRDCDALVLESNYDRQMLIDSEKRPLYLKRRIAGSIGHLDNLMAASALDDLVTRRTRLLLLAHISRECNTPEIALSECMRELEHLGRSDITVEPLDQCSTTGPFALEEVAL